MYVYVPNTTIRSLTCTLSKANNKIQSLYNPTDKVPQNIDAIAGKTQKSQKNPHRSRHALGENAEVKKHARNSTMPDKISAQEIHDQPTLSPEPAAFSPPSPFSPPLPSPPAAA